MATHSVELVRGSGVSLLRLATAGSVDDGKSTLVGRLLYDSKSVLTDQLESVRKVSTSRGLGAPDLALLTDGLRAEREQGITIDVAYRYFTTHRRRFTLADTPGHVQYTRNMVTGASTAELVIVLVDAREGVVEQTRRHAAVTALLRVPHVVLAVNKMDLVDWDESVFAAIAEEFEQYVSALGSPRVSAIPMSALHGDNVVSRSSRSDWYAGPTLLEYLEQVPTGTDVNTEPTRLPVQYVIRPQTPGRPDFRGFAGQLTSGVLRVGDRITVLPSGQSAVVSGLELLGEPVNLAWAPQSVTVRLAVDIDVGRGDLIAVGAIPERTRTVVGTVCHLDDKPLRAGERVLFRYGTRTVRGVVRQLTDKVDLTSLRSLPAPAELAVNDIGGVVIGLAEDVAIDSFAASARTGSFLLVDPVDGMTRTAGMAS